MRRASVAVAYIRRVRRRRARARALRRVAAALLGGRGAVALCTLWLVVVAALAVAR